MNDLLIGTGYYSTREQQAAKLEFFYLWLRNTPAANIVVVDNSDCILRPDKSVLPMPPHSLRLIRVTKNLGHMSAPNFPGRLVGWSLSWMIGALIAYSEYSDFLYKEQDCLTFGDWLPHLRQARACFGSHAHLDCENCLFYLERNFIPDFVSAYLAIPERDSDLIHETKFKLIEALFPLEIARHSLQPGRARPLPIGTPGPWTAQQFTAAELAALKSAALV